MVYLDLETAAGPTHDNPAPRAGVVVTQLWQWHSGEFCPVDTFTPPVNVYRLEDRLEICVDLAGIAPAEVAVSLENDRLVIRGFRNAPEPRRQPEPMRIVTMEIMHGPFCRSIVLPQPVDVSRVTTEYRNGLLWIKLPLPARR